MWIWNLMNNQSLRNALRVFERTEENYIEALRGALCEDAPALTRARRAAAPAIALASSLAIGLSSISDPTRWPFVVAFTALLLVMTFALTPKRDA